MPKYIQPPTNYNFRDHHDFKTLIQNSNQIEDPNLLPLIQKLHFQIDYIPRKNELENNQLKVPILEGERIVKKYSPLQTKKFLNLTELENFITNESENNYFILVTFLELEIDYLSIPFEYKIQGLYEELGEEIRDYKLKKLLEG